MPQQHAPLDRPRRGARGSLRGRRLAVAAAAALTVLGGTFAPTAPAGAAGATTLRIGTYNIQAGRAPSEVETAIGKVLPRVDVLGLQEINGKDKGEVVAGFRDSGWGTYRAQPSAQEPLLWRADRFSLVGARGEKLSDAWYIADERPKKGQWADPKYATVVHLRDRATDEVVSFINVHLVAGGAKKGLPRPDRPRLAALYVTQVAALEALIERERADVGAVYTMGDYNISWTRDKKVQHKPFPYVTLRDAGLTSMWQTERPAEGGTRQNGLIDQVYTDDAALSASVAFDVEHSDHYPALATYAVGSGY